MSGPQTVDPAVSRAKFAREVAAYRALQGTYRKRGQILLDAEFPEVCVMFAAPKLRPSPIVACVVVDFTDYDLQPLSVRFVDPFTRAPLKTSEINIVLLRRPQVPPGMPHPVFLQMMQQGIFAPTQMLQTNGPEDPPFLCLPRVREYHDNPAHTGDAWLLHRRSGEGCLAFILDAIWSYGINPIEQFQVAVQLPAVGMAISLDRLPE